MTKNLGKLLFISFLVLSVSSCSNKKKDIPIFLSLLGGSSSKGSAVSSPAGTDTGIVAPEGSVVQQVDSSTVIVHLPVSDSESTSSGDSSEATDEASGDSSAAPIHTTIALEQSINDAVGEREFRFESSVTIPVQLQVKDENGPVSGAIVTILDTSNQDSPDVLFQQVTDKSGTASGAIQVPTTTESVQVNINLGSSIISSSVPVVISSDDSGPQQLIALNRDITVSGSFNPSSYFTDSDGDGIADAYDDYPDDPTRATVTRFPKEGVNTLAFEDLFPKAGDADLNDHVTFFSFEEDLNAQGNIVAIRGFFQHAARGAGYTHTLNLKLPVGSAADLDMITYRVNSNNKVIGQTPTQVRLSAQDLNKGFQILGRSNQTISKPNSHASHATNFALGDYVNFELVFDNPVPRSSIGTPPYDVFLYVENTKKEIHLPNKYFDASGKDMYMDPQGFPWAIIIPGRWKWQLESQDIRNPSQTGYADFMKWVNSKGTSHKEWYTNITNPSKVFPLPEESNIAGYLAKTAQENWLILSILLLIGGLGIGYYLTRRNPIAMS